MVGKLSGRSTWSCLGDEVLEVHVVDVGTDGTLQLEVFVDVPDGLTRKTEHVLVGCIAVLIEIPVWVLVILVVTIPVGIVAVGILIVLQPSLVVGTRQGHEVLTHVALGISKGRTILYLLTSIVGGEVEINRTCGGINTEVEVVTTHIGVRQDVLVAHIGNRETHTRLTGINREDGRVLSGETCAEEIGGVVRVHQEWTLLAIEILEHEIIGLRSPTSIGTRGAGCRKLAIVASAIYLLDVVPLSQLGIDSVRTIVLHGNLILLRLLGRNQDNTVGSTATIEGRGSRTFQYGHRLNIIRVDGRDSITQIITATFTSTAKVCIIQRHTIHHVERLVVACHFCITTKEHAGRTRSTASRILHDETSHLT